MAVFLKDIRNDLLKYPRDPKQYPRLQLSKLESKSAPDLKSVIFKSFVKSEKSGNSYANYIQFFKVEFSENKDKEFEVPAESEGRLLFHKKPSVSENPVFLRCSCDDFRFRFEKPLYDNGGLMGNFRPYTRKTPPPPEGHLYLNPAQNNMKPQSAESYIGFCKHIFSMLQTLRESGYITE